MFISSLNNKICNKIYYLSINSLPNYTTHYQSHKHNTSTIYEQILFWPTQRFLHHINNISHLCTNTILIHNNLDILSYSDRKNFIFPTKKYMSTFMILLTSVGILTLMLWSTTVLDSPSYLDIKIFTLLCSVMTNSVKIYCNLVYSEIL